MKDVDLLITAIKELTKKRRLIYINYEPAFALYSGEVKQFLLKENSILSKEVYEQIIVILNKRATVRAMALLKDKDYSIKGLTLKLKDGYYPEESINSAVEYVSSYGYLDDVRYATNYVNFKSEKKTRKQIELELFNRGIDKNTIDMVCEEFYSENKDIELNNALGIIEKKYYDISNRISEMDYNEVQKIKGYLFRKGFSVDVINKALDIVANKF